MNLPRVLVIDDQYARDDNERQVFLEHAHLSENGASAGLKWTPVAEAVFCSGQKVTRDRLVNDYSVIRDAVSAGRTDGRKNWAMVLLDVRFDSGPLDDFGVPQGQEGDDYFGEEVRKRLATEFPDLPVVMLSGKRQEELSDRDTPYLSKAGLSPREFSLCLLRHGRLSPDQTRILLNLEEGVIANSPRTIEVFREAYAIADKNLSVLILGETGTGKEVIARYLHSQSERHDAPFVAINVAALPSELVETELFGIEDKIATGVKKRKGRFELANGGTLFLDEIGDMPLPVQAKVLRALQEKTILRVGGDAPVKIDVRIVAATSRNLVEMIIDGSFREDLFYRLSGKTLDIPPLRKRKEDIIPLAEMFLEKYSLEMGKQGISLSQEARTSLEQHPFFGNVRELENIIRHLVSITGNNRVVSAKDVEKILADSLVATVRLNKGSRPEETVFEGSRSGPAKPDDKGLEFFLKALKTIKISENDPVIRGIKPLLEEVFQYLRKQLAGAALERCRDPVTGKLNLQGAMRLLSGDQVLKGKEPRRQLNEILGRKPRDVRLTEEELEELVRFWKMHAEIEKNKQGE